MSGVREAGCAILHTGAAPPELLWVERAAGISLAGFQAFPGGAVEPCDETLPTDSGADGAAPRAAVAALRELFEEVGVLLADGAERLSVAERAALRDAFRRDAREGAALFRGHGLRFRTAAAEPAGRWVTPDVGAGLKRYDTRFFAFEVPSPLAVTPDPAEIAGAEWVRAEAALGRWASGELLVAPPIAAVLRGATARFDAGAMRTVRGAAGDPLEEYEVLPGLVMLPLRTPTLPPATHTNCFLVGRGEMVLIEPASPYEEDIERAVALVRRHQEAGATVRAILATHHHPDHIGGALALEARLGLPLWAHRLTAERLEGEVRFGRLIEDGEELVLGGGETRIEAIHTPGHAPGHLCFVEKGSGAMIAGDMVAGIGTILVEPTDGDMALYLESLRLMAERGPSMLLPAHGGPILDAIGKLEHYVEHRLMREEKVYAALEAHGGPATPAQLVPVAYDDAPVAVHPIAALATEAHLLKLLADHRIHRTGDASFTLLPEP